MALTAQGGRGLLRRVAIILREAIFRLSRKGGVSEQARRAKTARGIRRNAVLPELWGSLVPCVPRCISALRPRPAA